MISAEDKAILLLFENAVSHQSRPQVGSILVFLCGWSLIQYCGRSLQDNKAVVGLSSACLESLDLTEEKVGLTGPDLVLDYRF